MSDLSVSVGSSLIQNLFSSLSYPWRKRVDAALALDDDDIEAEFVDLSDDADLSGNEPDFVADLLNAYLAASAQERTSGDVEKALHDLFSPYVDGNNPRISTVAAGALDQMASDPAFPKKLDAFLKTRGPSVGLDWIEFELSEKPSSHMGNPLRLEGLKIGVRAKGHACIKVLGKEFCIRFTTPWFRFTGKKAATTFVVDGLKIAATAEVENVDFVIKVKIWKWSFSIRIGVTKYINKYLRNQKPVLADFSAVVIRVPGLDRTYKPSAISMPQDPATTQLLLDGKFS